MSNRRYTHTQIFGAVSAVEAGRPVSSVAAKLGCHPGSVSGWGKKYGGLALEEIRRQISGSVEVEALRRAAIRHERERQAWTIVIRALAIPLSKRIQIFGQLVASKLVSVNQAKRLLCMGNPHSSLIKYERDDTVVLNVMKRYLAKFPSHGFDTMFHQEFAGRICGAVRAKRIYSAARLQLYRRSAKRTCATVGPLEIAPWPNVTWSIDFMHFRLKDDIPARTLNVIDDCTRECLLIRAFPTTSAALVAKHLAALTVKRGVPTAIRCDNGPEFVGRAFTEWAEGAGIKVQHIEPYKGYQNGYIERFNRTVRGDLMRWNTFSTLEHFDRMAEDFRFQYNHCRPHKSLGWSTPAQYASRRLSASLTDA